MNKKRYNVILYFTDQQRADTLGCYGQELDVSPVLDKLAKEGVLFENAFTPQPVCGPARACIQTGRYPTETGCYVNGIGLDYNEITIAKELNKVGYETAYVGKWHLASDFTKGIHYETSYIPRERMGGYKDYVVACDTNELCSHGYDGYLYDCVNNKRMDFIGYRADCVTDFAIHYIQNKNNDKPFFLMLSHLEPHHQNDRDRFEGPDGSKERFKDYKVPEDLLNGKYEGDWKENYPDYLGACRSLDDNLGKLIRTLKEKGIYEDTVIIFVSDHGCHFRTQDGEYKRNFYDSCLRVPLVIYGGEFKGGIRCEKLVSLINLPATILEIAGVKPPKCMRYPSIQAIMKNENLGNTVFYQISESFVGRGIRTAKWKYVVHAPHAQDLGEIDHEWSLEAFYEMVGKAKMNSDTYVELGLFDLENDPYEKHNLVADPVYKQVREELRINLIHHMLEAGEDAPEIYPAGTKLENKAQMKKQ